MKSDNLKIEIEKQISKLKLKNGSTLYVAGNLYNFGFDKNNISNFCKHFLKSLKKKNWKSRQYYCANFNFKFNKYK